MPDWLAQAVPDALDCSEQKNILRLDLTRPDQLTVKAIIVPARTDSGEALVESIPQSLALRHPATSTLLQCQVDQAGPVELMGRLVRAVPAFRLSMLRDPDRSVAAVASLLAELSAA